MIIGGVLCRPDCERQFITELGLIRKRPEAGWPFEWKNIRGRNLRQYEKIVDLFFEYNTEHCLDFSCLVVDCNQVDHDRHSEGDGDKGFNKFLYQHLLKHYRTMEPPSRFRCYHDRRGSRYTLDDIKQMLNFKNNFEGGKIVQPYREISYSDKQIHPMLQIADILIGAVGYSWNDKLRLYPDTPRTKLCEHIRGRACLKDLSSQTFYNSKHFSIWPFKLS